MAKRKKAKTRVVYRKAKTKARRYARKSLAGKSLIQVDAMIYGAVRQKASTMLSPFTSKIPIGSLADEVGMGLLNYMVAKKSKGLLQKVAMKGLAIENARVGEAVVNGELNLGMFGGQASASNGYTIIR